MAPNITLRILGKSANYTQPNDVLWFLTMNQTKISPDLASRGMPIRLYYEGDPATRVFEGPNPLEYASSIAPRSLANCSVRSSSGSHAAVRSARVGTGVSIGPK